MIKKPLFISVQPDDMKYCTQIRVQLFNFRKYGYSSNYHVIFFQPHSRLDLPNPEIENLVRDFPEAKFFVYKDFRNIERLGKIFDYQPILRPWCLHEHWTKFPELEFEQFFYLDSDVIFTKYLDFNPLDNKTQWLSSTPYIGVDHFNSKQDNVRADKAEEYFKRNIVSELGELVGIKEEIIIKNDSTVGGAQYLLYGIKPEFWNLVINNSIEIRSHLKEFNQKYFVGNTPQEREVNGLQSWCADMWALLYNLWKEGYTTQTPEELNFCWNTDLMEKWETNYLYHDAGTSGEWVGDKKTYYKGKESYNHIWNHPQLRTPFQDDLTDISPELCSSKYVEEILACKSYFNL